MEFDLVFWSFIVRWLHVIAGVMWIGLLWYFNFVEVPAIAEMSDEEKSVVSKHIAPRAMFWFRHAAMSTMVFGLLLAWMQGYIWDALALGLTSGENLPRDGRTRQREPAEQRQVERVIQPELPATA